MNPGSSGRILLQWFLISQALVRCAGRAGCVLEGKGRLCAGAGLDAGAAGMRCPRCGSAPRAPSICRGTMELALLSPTAAPELQPPCPPPDLFPKPLSPPRCPARLRFSNSGPRNCLPTLGAGCETEPPRSDPATWTSLCFSVRPGQTVSLVTFVATTCEGAHYVKHTFFFPACENSAERWGILTTPQPSIYRLVRHRLWASLKRKLAAFDPSGSWMRLLSQPLLRAQPSELLYLYLIKDSKPTSTMHKYWSAAWKLKSLHLSALRSLMEPAWWCRIFLLSQQRGKSWLQEWFANTAPWKEKCRASSIVSEWNVTFSQKLSCLGWQRLGNCAFLERWLQWQR